MTLNINKLELSGKNIIVVEDDLPSIRYYETLLRNSGANVKIFRNGKEFIEHLNQNKVDVDLIFMDFLIPLVNGIECVRFFRK
jgi:CheY-like chemotaxis protein